jgi:general secretion pathway protein K
MRSRRRQAGVALITAVLIVALATILAVSVGFKGFLGQRRTATTFALDQAYEVAMGGEAWASDALQRDAMEPTAQGATATDDFTDVWATPIPPIPVDGGEFEGTLEDLQGRFNLNNLVKLDQNRSFVIDPKSVERLERLLDIVQVETKWAKLIADFIDSDSNPEFPDGAEDPTYTGLNPPYRTPNTPITRTSELLAIAGFGQQRFRRLEPFVTALPVGTTINLCTAPPEVLDSLSARQRQYTLARESTAKQREIGCFPTTMDFQAALSQTERTELTQIVGQTSDFFQSTIFVTIGTTQFTLYSLLYRKPGMGVVRPTLRSFGTP